MAEIGINGNPILPGSKAIVPAATLENFAMFVNGYWNKKRRSGALWTIPAIIDDSGLSNECITLFWGWCRQQPEGTTDAAMVSGTTISQSPFGTAMAEAAPIVPTDSRKLGDLTVGEFKAIFPGLK